MNCVFMVSTLPVIASTVIFFKNMSFCIRLFYAYNISMSLQKPNAIPLLASQQKLIPRSIKNQTTFAFSNDVLLCTPWLFICWLFGLRFSYYVGQANSYLSCILNRLPSLESPALIKNAYLSQVTYYEELGLQICVGQVECHGEKGFFFFFNTS